MSQSGDGQHLLTALVAACEGASDRLSVYNIPGLMVGYARRNDKRPAYLSFSVNDDVVKNLKGDEKLRDLFLMVRIPRDVVDAMTGEPQTEPRDLPEAVEA